MPIQLAQSRFMVYIEVDEYLYCHAGRNVLLRDVLRKHVFWREELAGVE